MFRPEAQRISHMRTGFELIEVIYHATVRQLRGSHSNAVVALVMNVLQAVLVLVLFVVMFDLLGMRRLALRGDFILYVMSGVFMFLTHVKALGAVAAADSPASAMMMHAPMNPIIAVVSAALAALYKQTFAAGVILFVYHAVMQPITIFDPIGTMGMFILSWASGAAIGLIFYAAKPWQPDLVGILSTIYQRANMIASGKMFVANQASAWLRSKFDWNPLYHTIDQARGDIFLNYQPRYTNIEYPIWAVMVCLMIGLMGQFFTRKYASASWGKRR
ncbi:ABC transporter permease [Rhodobacter sp. 24-YEA-8]|uniref:ABC transporter permease n=1 Tax=Rhodobacter sp. 24-YEA-8 TaxID=1884310 RepID=UPI000898CF1B|nr:ABC transporter permease [Rhodobacter sp. 24-YEA-8]SEC47194.1 ABC-type polysaccharide/polyol phosphate export permease [Rhodobacter sp. 24-YEA-8]